jgi:P27 family predicted phage terminase small subunit
MGERGPKPTPPALQLVRGDPRNQGKAKLAALLDETIRPAVEIPDAPKTLSKEARDEWERIAPHLARLGLISQIDRAALAAYCTAWGDYEWAEKRIAEINRGAREVLKDDQGQPTGKLGKRHADKTGERGRIGITPSGYQQISVVMQIRNRALEFMAKFLAEFGMSPAARTRVTPSDTAGSQASLPGMDKPQEDGWAQFNKPTT